MLLVMPVVDKEMSLNLKWFQVNPRQRTSPRWRLQADIFSTTTKNKARREEKEEGDEENFQLAQKLILAVRMNIDILKS